MVYKQVAELKQFIFFKKSNFKMTRFFHMQNKWVSLIHSPTVEQITQT